MGGFLGDGSPPSRVVEGKYAPTLSSRACVQMDCRNASKTRQVVVPTQAMTGWVAALSSLVCRGLAATRRRKQDRLQYQPTLMVFDGEGCCRVLRGFLWRSAGCFAAFVGEVSAPSRVEGFFVEIHWLFCCLRRRGLSAVARRRGLQLCFLSCVLVLCPVAHIAGC